MKNNVSNLLTRRITEVVGQKSLEQKLASGKKLRVKLGIDPTGEDLHLGHAVPLMKLREFQDAGHIAVFIIGDWTARIGDPSGKDKTRKTLTEKEVKHNAKLFFNQANLILDKKRVEVHYQSKWYKKFGLKDLIKIASRISVHELLTHDTFKKRLDNDLPLATHELLYPLLQGYDSVMVRADVELGATEQKFNILMGRKIQKIFQMSQQDILLMPYLIGMDGRQKMSKTLNNYIALNDSADEMFGKTMSIPDTLIRQYFELCTNLFNEEIESMLKKNNPKDAKVRLAYEITKIYHGVKQAVAAQKNFENKYSKGRGEVTADFEVSIGSFGPYKTSFITKPGKILTILMIGGLATSHSDARRKIKEGAVDVDGKRVNNEKEAIPIKIGTLVRLGKRFLKII